MEPTDKSKVKRSPKLGHYDKATIYKILDNDFVCQVAFVHRDYPVIIPTIYGRKEDMIYIHGAAVSRMLVELEKGFPISINVTRTDGIVLARSAFNHSLNYHSVAIFGKAELVLSEVERNEALKIISDNVIPGRWEEVRLPSKNELKATKVLKIPIHEASAKIRTGAPIDAKEDYELPIWAGEIPIKREFDKPVVDPAMNETMPLPNSVNNLYS